MDKSKAFSKIINRIQTKTYKTDRLLEKANRDYLQKTKMRLTQKKNSNIKYKAGHKHKLEKLNAILEELGSPVSNEEVGINETLSQGDCFYSGIFRALKERDLLQTVCLALNLRGSTEVRFITSFRELVANEVLAGRLPSDLDQYGHPENSYDMLSGLGSNITNIIDGDEQHEIWPEWFAKEFRNGVGKRPHFLKKFAKWSKKRKEYVGQIEVEIVTRLLQKIGILLEIDGTIKSIIPRMKEGLPLITLFNEHGGHYEYYSYNTLCKRNEKRDLKTRRCVRK